jgi:hypothetical protein
MQADGSGARRATLEVSLSDGVLLIADAPSQSLPNPPCRVLAVNSVGSLLQPDPAFERSIRVWPPTQSGSVRAFELSGQAAEAEAVYKLIGPNLSAGCAAACGRMSVAELLDKVDEGVERLLLVTPTSGQPSADAPLEIALRYQCDDEVGGTTRVVLGSETTRDRFKEASCSLAARTIPGFFKTWDNATVNGLLYQEELFMIFQRELSFKCGAVRFFVRTSPNRFTFAEMTDGIATEIRSALSSSFLGVEKFDERKKIVDPAETFWPRQHVLYLCEGVNFPVADAFMLVRGVLLLFNATVSKLAHKTSGVWLRHWAAFARKLSAAKLALVFLTPEERDQPVCPRGVSSDVWTGVGDVTFGQVCVDGQQAFSSQSRVGGVNGGGADGPFITAVKTVIDASYTKWQMIENWEVCKEYKRLAWMAA